MNEVREDENIMDSEATTAIPFTHPNSQEYIAGVRY
jgi:hypothetical protein